MKAKINLWAFILCLVSWAFFTLISFDNIGVTEPTRSILFNICLFIAGADFILSLIGFKEIKNSLSALRVIVSLVLSLGLAVVCGFIILTGKLLG